LRSFDGGDDFIRTRSPGKALFWDGFVEEAVDGIFKFLQRPEHAALFVQRPSILCPSPSKVLFR
jgi:hypothetical protein